MFFEKIFALLHQKKEEQLKRENIKELSLDEVVRMMRTTRDEKE